MKQFPNMPSPLKIGNTEVRNRILASAVSSETTGNIPQEMTQAFL